MHSRHVPGGAPGRKGKRGTTEKIIQESKTGRPKQTFFPGAGKKGRGGGEEQPFLESATSGR